MTVEYHPALAAELEQIRDYYNARRPGLGWSLSMNLSD